MDTLPFGPRPGEVKTGFMDVCIDVTYRVWLRCGACFLSFESKVLDIESDKIEPSDQGKIAPFHLFKFENGTSIRSRNGWGVHFYRKETP